MMSDALYSTTTVEEESSVDLRQYLSLFLHWWWLVALAMLVAGGAAYLISIQMTPIYRASTTLLIDQARSNGPADYSSLMTNELLAQTYAEMLTKRPVLEETIQRLGIEMTSDELGGMVSVSPIKDTQLVEVDVTGSDPNQAAALANALVVIFGQQVQETQSARFAASLESLKTQIDDAELQMSQTQQSINALTDPDEIERQQSRLDQYKQIQSSLLMSYESIRMTQAQTSSSVVQIESAIVPTSPIGPNTMRNTLLAALVGAMLAVGGIFTADSLDDTLKSPDEITRRLKLPVMGAIARFDEPEDGRLITQAEPRSPITESFRALRTNVQYASVDDPVRTLMITSPTPADGKTTVVSNLAVVMAQVGRQVTVVDADLHRPRVHSVFKTDNRPGLSSLFIQPNIYLNGAFQSTLVETLHVVSAGALPPNPSELLGSNKMREILDVLLQKSDMVLVDTPPVLSVTDAVVLAPLVDGVLIVVKPGVTKVSMIKSTVDQLRYVGANVIGVVINGFDEKNSRYGYYYRSYYYKSYKYYGKAESDSHKKGRGAETSAAEHEHQDVGSKE